jgi:hypothetical protein
VTAAKFNADLTAWFAKNVTKRTLEVQAMVCQEVIIQAVQVTPTGNEKNWKRAIRNPAYKKPGYVGGHARRNWQINFGTPLRNVLPGVDRGGETIRAAVSTIAGFSSLGRVYITNNVPYISVIDEGKPGTNPRFKPWSRQAPRGLLRPILDGVRRKLATIR